MNVHISNCFFFLAVNMFLTVFYNFFEQLRVFILGFILVVFANKLTMPKNAFMQFTFNDPFE